MDLTEASAQPGAVAASQRGPAPRSRHAGREHGADLAGESRVAHGTAHLSAYQPDDFEAPWTYAAAMAVVAVLLLAGVVVFSLAVAYYGSAS